MLKILCTAEFDDEWTQRFQEMVQFDRVGFSLDKDPGKRMNEEEIIQALQGYDIHISGYEKLTRNVLYRCPDLKLILSVRDGPEENIDIEACTELGIPVLFSSGRCARSVPEFTFLLMMLLIKPVQKSSETLRNEKWNEKNDLKLRRINEESSEMAGKKVGLIGFGRNGKGLAERCRAFQMYVMAYDPYVDEQSMKELGVKKAGIEEIFRDSDFVVTLARVSKETRGMINRALIWSMKKDACFINTARAALVDNEALADALIQSRIRAALDVFEQEPLPEDSRFYEIPKERLLLTPHLAGVSIERITYQSEKLYQAFAKYISGEMPDNIANREVFECNAFERRGRLIFGHQE